MHCWKGFASFGSKEGVVRCSDCKALWDNVVISCFINKIEGMIGEAVAPKWKLYVLSCVYFCNRSATQRVPLRLWRSTSPRWGKFTGRTGRACRESRPGRLFLVMWWRFLVRLPKIEGFPFASLPAACTQSPFSHWRRWRNSQNHCDVAAAGIFRVTEYLYLV